MESLLELLKGCSLEPKFQKEVRQLAMSSRPKEHLIYLTKHGSFRFYTANSPSSNTQSINHSGVRVCANNTVWVKKSICVENNSGKVF
uniref:Uncharacterized protein n=1 Tax=Arabidopsis thaliana TaxID=3702 RepID=Q0WLR6_ARATH|nr:hypothetical protein [Arabidopsis thaliana]